jgi:hypothetical protein
MIGNQWIPVGDRLPPDNVAALVYNDPSGLEVEFRTDGQLCIPYTNYPYPGTGHIRWMPLPEPPKVQP